MSFLVKFLYRNLKGYRLLVILAILVTIAQVGSDLLAAMPLKFIPSKVNNPGSDPACTFPFLDGFLSNFDTSVLDPSLRPPLTPLNQPPRQPPLAPCPATPSDPTSILHPRTTQHSVIGVIVFSLLMLAVFGLLSAGLVYVELSLATYIAQGLSARLREQLFDHLQRLALDWHDRQKKGDLVQRVTGNITDIEKLVNDGLVDFLAGVLTLIGVAAIMFIISREYTLLALAIAPVLFILVFTYTNGIKAAAKKKAKAAGQIADVATEDINALTLIRAFTLEKKENLRFGRYVGTHREAGLRVGWLQAQFTPLVSVLVVFGTISVLGVGGYVAAGNAFNLGIFTVAPSTIDIGTLVLFLTYLKMLYQPMRDLSKLTSMASNAASGAERIQEVLDQAPEVVDIQGPYRGPQKLKGDITFENVIFGYTNDHPVLKGINLYISVGRKIALVGYSGGGKTTLAKLIPRFYEIEAGSVKIDNVDNRMYPLHILRQNISMVLQDSVLFEGTIRENLEIGRPGAPLEDIIEAAKKANIHGTIMKLPDAYDTIVREQGNNFSAGQRQRLSIARAILRDAPILLLDEPTANLDVESESEVMHALNTLIAGRTVLTISHRLSTLGNVDEILVMDKGQIAERGTFKELKQKKGIFAHLLEEQNRYNLDRDEDDESIVRSVAAPRIPVVKSLTPSRIPVEVPVTSSLKEVEDAEEMQPRTLPRIPAVTASALSASRRLDPLTPLPLTLSGSAIAETVLAGHQNGHEKHISTNRESQERNAHFLLKAQVCIETDGKLTDTFPLNKPVLAIGRFPNSDIQIASLRVSRFHALIRWKSNAWIIEDAESLNGLSFEGQRIDQLGLVNGDRIHIDPRIVLLYEELP